MKTRNKLKLSYFRHLLNQKSDKLVDENDKKMVVLKGRKGSLGGLVGPQGSPQWQKVVTCCREKDAGGGGGENLFL